MTNTNEAAANVHDLTNQKLAVGVTKHGLLLNSANSVVHMHKVDATSTAAFAIEFSTALRPKGYRAVTGYIKTHIPANDLSELVLAELALNVRAMLEAEYITSMINGQELYFAKRTPLPADSPTPCHSLFNARYLLSPRAMRGNAMLHISIGQRSTKDTEAGELQYYMIGFIIEYNSEGNATANHALPSLAVVADDLADLAGATAPWSRYIQAINEGTRNAAS